MKLKMLDNIKKILPVLVIQRFKDEVVLVVSSKNIVFSLNCLKNHLSYQYRLLSSISGVDFLGKTYRFSIVYDLLSLTYNIRIRIKAFLTETDVISSCVSVFSCANWWEREVWDLYGIFFTKHPDLRRILTDYGFEGHPMRKDFPLQGFIELRYDESKKRIVVEPVELSQEMRFFSFETPW